MRARRAVGIAVVLGITLSAMAWDAMDRSPPHDDDFTVYTFASCLAETLPVDPFEAACPAPYPPLVPLVGALHLLATGDRGLQAAVASGWVWYALMAGALFAGVRRESGALAGAAAALLGTALWLASGLRNAFYTELGLSALVVAGVAALAATDTLSRPGRSLLAGVVLGLGMLVKWSFAFFLALPAAIVVLASLARAGRGGLLLAVPLFGTGLAIGAHLLDRLPHAGAGALVLAGVTGAGMLALAKGSERWCAPDGRVRVASVALFVLGVAVALPWYEAARAGNATFLDRNLAFSWAGDRLTPWESAPFYPGMALAIVGLPFVTLAIAGAARTALPGRTRIGGLALVAVVSGVFVLSLLPYRAARYAAPVWPLLGILAVVPGTGPRVPLALLRGALVALGVAAHLTWVSPALTRYRTLPLMDGIAGNTRAGVARARAFLTDPPVFFPIFAAPPFPDPPDVDAMWAVMSAGGARPLLVLEASPRGELTLPLRAAAMPSIGSNGAGQLRIESAGADLEAVQRRLATYGGRVPRGVFVLQIAEERAPSWGAGPTGLTVLWEREVDMLPRRTERVWGVR